MLTDHLEFGKEVGGAGWRGLRGNKMGSKKAGKNTGRCRFVVDQEHAFPATAAGRDAADAKAIEIARRRDSEVRIDFGCVRQMQEGEPLKLRALIAKCKPSGCEEYVEHDTPGRKTKGDMNGLGGRPKDPWPYQRNADVVFTKWEHGGPRTYRQNRQGTAKVKGRKLVNDYNVARKGLTTFLRKLQRRANKTGLPVCALVGREAVCVEPGGSRGKR